MNLNRITSIVTLQRSMDLLGKYSELGANTRRKAYSKA